MIDIEEETNGFTVAPAVCNHHLPVSDSSQLHPNKIGVSTRQLTGTITPMCLRTAVPSKVNRARKRNET